MGKNKKYEKQLYKKPRFFKYCPYCGSGDMQTVKERLLRCNKCKSYTLNTVKTSKTREWYGSNIDGTICVCGRKKTIGRSFCSQCHIALPDELKIKIRRQKVKWARKPLISYVELFEEIEQWLRINSPTVMAPE